MCEEKDEVWMLNRVREWLKQGCTIQAANTGKPILYKLQQGEWYTGLIVTWPEKPPVFVPLAKEEVKDEEVGRVIPVTDGPSTSAG